MSMRKIPVFLFSFFFFLSIPVITLAQDTQTPTLSDAVLADLATRNYLDNASVFMYDQKDSQAIAINQDKQWIPASTVKTYVAMFAYDQIAKNVIQSSDTVTIDGKNLVPSELDTPELPAFQVGEEVTIDRLIRQMITQSDNTAYNTLLDVLDRRAITNYVHTIGLTHTEIGSKLNLDDVQSQYEQEVPGFGINSTTAQDYANAFLLIKNDKIPLAQDLFTVLSQQKINDMLPLLLPKDAIVAHKPGNWDPLYHDGGIIKLADNKGSYIVSIFTNLGDPNIVAHISQLIYTKDYNLVGKELASTQSIPSQPIDPLLLTPPIPIITPEPSATRVLGITDILQKITAADLGIKPADLSLGVNQSQLPNVYIPANSYFHNVVPLFYLAKRLVAFTPSARAQVDIEALNQQVAEANNLLGQGNKDQAYALLNHVQQQLTTVAKETTLSQDPNLQSKLAQVSQSKFQLLGTQLQKANTQDKLAIINIMAAQAKQTLTTINPSIPQATNTTALTAHPLIGKVVEKTNTSMVVQTTGGEKISVSLDQAPIKVREQSQIQYQTSDAIQTGTSVAMVGSVQDSHFVPTFVLTKVPQELVAPQPVTVVKVNEKNNSLIVVDNGVNVQVDLTKQSVIKSNSTDLSIASLKQGDTVVVHGQPLPPVSSITPTVAPNTTPSSVKQTTGITGIATGIPISVVPETVTITGFPSGYKQVLTPTGQKLGGISPAIYITGKNGAPITLYPSTIPHAGAINNPTGISQTGKTTVTQPVPPAIPLTQRTHVIIGNTIQVIQTKQQERSNPKPPAPSQNTAPKHDDHPSAPAPAAPGPKQQAPQKSTPSGKK